MITPLFPRQFGFFPLAAQAENDRRIDQEIMIFFLVVLVPFGISSLQISTLNQQRLKSSDFSIRPIIKYGYKIKIWIQKMECVF